ncbi:MAG: dihydrofolate reductase [Eubacteriales bacterium]|nr:dihydrofolate reductase [Eubacteriales bacterium]
MDAIVAVNDDWGIGADGTQSFVLRADRKFFSEMTKGCAVIVGRRTMEDFPGGKPLKNRPNIVVTRSEVQIEGAEVVHSTEEALAAASGYEKVMVIGGASVYMQFFSLLDRVYVTKIDAHAESTAYFPNLDHNPDFVCEHEGEEQEENGIKFRFCTYKRKK